MKTLVKTCLAVVVLCSTTASAEAGRIRILPFPTDPALRNCDLLEHQLERGILQHFEDCLSPKSKYCNQTIDYLNCREAGADPEHCKAELGLETLRGCSALFNEIYRQQEQYNR